ncbi:serine hydrolase [Natrialbaceae archaeon A-CW1-1]
MGKLNNTIAKSDRSRIEDFITKVMEEDDLPGIGISIVSGSDTVYTNGFGARNLTTNAPVTENTLFGLGSTTKSFTALGIMRLVDEGKLELDDPVTDYLPIECDRDVTVHHLLTHTSGAPSNGMANVLLSRLTGVGDSSVPMSDMEDFYTFINGTFPDEVVAEPGERFFYYATGFTLLGEIIEEVTDQQYSNFMEKSVLDPLEMERSTFNRKHFDATEDRMTPYIKSESGFEERPYPLHKLTEATGGLVASPIELANYVNVQMNKGIFGDDQLLSTAVAEQMHIPHTETQGDYGQYGYGWMIREFLDDTLVSHSGDSAVGTASIGFLEDAQIGVTLTCNTSPGYRLGYLLQGVLAILQGETPREVVPLFKTRKQLDKLTGNYESYRGIKDAEVIRNGGSLEVTMSSILGSNTVTLQPLRKENNCHEFEMATETGDRAVVEFVETDSGIEMIQDRFVLHSI